MKNFQFGIDVLKNQKDLLEKLKEKKVALLGHPASVDKELNSSVDIIRTLADEHSFTLSSLFGPQHGFCGEKQDNMIESYDSKDSKTGLRTFSLYGKTRRLNYEMIQSFDVIFVDLQDVGVRVYTFLTTLCYLLEDLQNSDKEIIILDRPNPTGRAMDGLILHKGWESFVGITTIPMQHGLTLGEFASWYKSKKNLTTALTILPMENYSPRDVTNAWPASQVWLQPSPNMPALYTARSYPGTVMLEGTTLSEARGTTRPLSMLGHPDVNWQSIYIWLEKNAKETLKGCFIRDVVFQPTFHKHSGIPCPGFEIVAEGTFYKPAVFKPYLLIASILKAIHITHPDIELWSQAPYEYEFDKLPIDIISGGETIRRWIESNSSTVQELSEQIEKDIKNWETEVEEFFIY